MTDDALASNERATFVRDPQLDDLELLHAAYVTHTFAPHFHDGYAIGVIEAGAERFRYRRALHVAPAGSVVVVEPGEMHTGEAVTENGWHYRMLYPTVEFVQRALADVADRSSDPPSIRHPIIDDTRVAALISRAHRSIFDHATPLERESCVLWSLGLLFTRHADERRPPRPITREHDAIETVRAYLHERYADAVTLDDLAGLVHLSPFHLIRTFRGTVGLPPHAYQNYLRINHAKRLLSGGYSIAATAHAVGFADQSHLTRHFKRVVGVPPGQYARSSKNIQDTI